MHRGELELGLGLLSIGRTWGVRQVPPPSEGETDNLLQSAVTLGIRAFDTAPAYRASEQRLGRFLRTIRPEERDGLVVMTKVGEHWDEDRGEPFVDHGRDALIRSIDRSFERLGRIEVIQIHKATKAIVNDPEVLAGIAHARSCGVPRVGASVSDVATGEAALATGIYDVLQFPLNVSARAMLPLLAVMGTVTPIINRPFGMGVLLMEEECDPARRAFRFLAEQVSAGIILTGTSRPDHLAANVEAFHARAA